MSVPFGNIRWALKETGGGRYYSIPGSGWSDVKSLDISDTYPSEEIANISLTEYVKSHPVMQTALKDVKPNKVVYHVDEYEPSRDWDKYVDENNYIVSE